MALYGWLRRRPWLYDVEHDSLRAGYRNAAHVLLRGATMATAWRYRIGQPAWRRRKPLRLNLGSGREPLPGWINVDLNPFARREIWLDIRDRWPLSAGTVQTVYIRHCLEHFSESEAVKILRQCGRVLVPGGAIRIGVPSLEVALQKYRDNDFECMPWVLGHRSPGRRFYRYMMDNDNHRIMFDYGYLAELLDATGFTEIVESRGGRSGSMDPSLLHPKDRPEDLTTLYVEARRS